MNTIISKILMWKTSKNMIKNNIELLKGKSKTRSIFKLNVYTLLPTSPYFPTPHTCVSSYFYKFDFLFFLDSTLK